MRLSATIRRVEAPLRAGDGQADRGGLERGPDAAAQAAAAIRRFAAEAASGERRAILGVEDGPGRRGGGAWCRCVRRNASAVIGRRVVLRLAPKSIVSGHFRAFGLQNSSVVAGPATRTRPRGPPTHTAGTPNFGTAGAASSGRTSPLGRSSGTRPRPRNRVPKIARSTPGVSVYATSMS